MGVEKMENKIHDTKNEEKLIGDKFINWGIFLIIFAPVLGVLSLWFSTLFVGWFIRGDGGVEALIILGGIATVGIGISLVIIGCSKNIIQKTIK